MAILSKDCQGQRKDSYWLLRPPEHALVSPGLLACIDPRLTPAFLVYSSFEKERSTRNRFALRRCDKLLCWSSPSTHIKALGLVCSMWFINPFTKAINRASGTLIPSTYLLNVVSLCQKRIPLNYAPRPNPTQLCNARISSMSYPTAASRSTVCAARLASLHR